MAKFKIGDKVILKPEVVLNAKYNNVSLYNTIYGDLKNEIKTNGFLIIHAYGSNETVVRISTNDRNWYVGEDALELYQEQSHIYEVGDIAKKEREDMTQYPFLFTAKSEETRQNSNLKTGDLVSICGMPGRIEIADLCHYYLEFDSPNQEHVSCCKKLREIVPNFDKIANKFGTICNINNELFPEFSTVDKLMQFVQAINAEYYNFKQPTILKKSETYEIRFQKPKTSSIRGSVPTGRAICGRRRKTAIELGHLSNTTCYC